MVGSLCWAKPFGLAMKSIVGVTLRNLNPHLPVQAVGALALACKANSYKKPVPQWK
jgi:hypothetical protein